MKDKMTYEQAMQRLEDIVSALQNGETPLSESLKLFEEGAKLVSFCNDELENAQLTVENLLGEKYTDEVNDD